MTEEKENSNKQIKTFWYEQDSKGMEYSFNTGNLPPNGNAFPPWYYPDRHELSSGFCCWEEDDEEDGGGP